MQTARKSSKSTAPAKEAVTSRIKKTKTTRSTKIKASKAKRPSSSSLFDTIVNVFVGPDHVQFGIHKALLCQRSSYFKGALTGRFKEAREGTVTLEDEDPEVFSRFNTWLYTGSCIRDDDDATLAMAPAFQLWLFAEKRMIADLQNAIIDQLITNRSTFDPKDGRVVQEISTEDEEACISAWQNTTDESRLRSFIVDFFSFHLDLERIFHKERAARYPLALITSIAIRAQKAGIDFSNDFFGDLRYYRCDSYHVHDDDDPMCEEMGEAAEQDTNREEEEPGTIRSTGGPPLTRSFRDR